MDYTDIDDAMAAVVAELGETGTVALLSPDVGEKLGVPAKSFDDEDNAETVDQYYVDNYKKSDPLNILTKGEITVVFHTLSGEPLSVQVDPTGLEPLWKQGQYSAETNYHGSANGHMIIRHTVLQHMVTAEYRRVGPPDESGEGYEFELDADQARFLSDGVEMEKNSQMFAEFTDLIIDGNEAELQKKFPFLQVMYRLHRYVPTPEEHAKITEANAEAGQRLLANQRANEFDYYGGYQH